MTYPKYLLTKKITRHIKRFPHFPPDPYHESHMAPQHLPVSSKIFIFYHLGFPLSWVNEEASIYYSYFCHFPAPQKSWDNLYKYKRYIQRNHSLKGELSTCDKWSGGRPRQGDYHKENRRQSKQANKLALSFLARNHDESQSTLFSLFIKGRTEIPEEKHQ